MASGTVKWFNLTKGYGFIQPDGDGPDVYVALSALEKAGLKELNEGQRLGFDVVADAHSGKTSAANLTVG